MIYFLFFLIGLGAVAYVGAPFRRRAAHEYSPASRHDVAQGRALGERRDNLLRQLKELEFDRKMGKTEGEEYALLREELSVEAAAVLQQLEAIEPASRAVSTHTSDTGTSDMASASSAAHMSTHATGASVDTRDVSLDKSDLGFKPHQIDLEIEAEVLVARARIRRRAPHISLAANGGATMVRGEAESAFCTACGHRLNGDDRFCARCGQRRATASALA